MQSAQIKKLAIYTMISSLVGAAAIAVVAVLIGSFTEILSKALLTLVVVTVHALVALSFVDNRAKTADPDDLRFFTNAIFILIVLSFPTAVFGIWQLLPLEVVSKLYETYFIVAFAAFHGEMLHKTTGLEAKITNIVYGNYVFMLLVVGLILPVVWVGADADLPDAYYRLLAASAIVDVTLTILAVILHRLYLQKHPEQQSELFTQVMYTVDASGNKVAQPVAASKRRSHPLLTLLYIYLACQFLGPILYWIGALSRR